ncbi:MAG: hypothetical protein AB7V19_07100, partial [Candidatus Bipolaricaulia bacterium]
DQGWTVFPETDGWDLVLVWRRPSVFDGPQEDDQFGIEAKLRASVDVLAQTHLRGRRSRGPDFRGVLVPHASGPFDYLASQLKIHSFSLKHCGPWKETSRYGTTWSNPRVDLHTVPRYRWDRRSRLWLPPVPLAGSGGSPSPRQLTKWRVGALKLCALIRARGYLTTEDFKEAKISPSRWPVQGWVVPDGKIGRLTRYVIGPSPLPDTGYEVERDALYAAPSAGGAA